MMKYVWTFLTIFSSVFLMIGFISFVTLQAPPMDFVWALVRASVAFAFLGVVWRYFFENYL